MPFCTPRVLRGSLVCVGLLGLAGLGHSLQAGWTAQSYVANEIYDIAYRPVLDGGGNIIDAEFVAVGRLEPDAGAILTREQEDTIRWRPRAASAKWSLYGVAGSVGDAAESWVAVGQHGTIMRSTDRIVWTSITGPTVRTLHDVAAGTNLSGDNLFVAVGDEGTLLTSTNGLLWLPRNVPTTVDLHAVAATGSTWAVVGDNGTLLLSGDGGMTWNIEPTGTTADLHAISLQPGVLHVGGENAFLASWFIAAGDTGLVPVTWLPHGVDPMGATIYDIGFFRSDPPPVGDPLEYYFAVGSDGFLAYAQPDLSTSVRDWIAVSSGEDIELNALASEGLDASGPESIFVVGGGPIPPTLTLPSSVVGHAFLVDNRGEPSPAPDIGELVFFALGIGSILREDDQLLFGGYGGLGFSFNGVQLNFAPMDAGSLDPPFASAMAKSGESVVIVDNQLITGGGDPLVYHYDGISLVLSTPTDFRAQSVATNGTGWILGGSRPGSLDANGDPLTFLPAMAYSETPWVASSWVTVDPAPLALDPGETVLYSLVFDVHYHNGVWALVGAIAVETGSAAQEVMAYAVTGSDADLAAAWDGSLSSFSGPPFTEVTWAGSASRPEGSLLAVTHGEGGGGNRWVMVGQDGFGAWGTPGSTWTPLTLPPGRAYMDVAWGGGAYKAVGFDAPSFDLDSGGVVAHSADGVNWSLEADGLPEGLMSVVYGPYGWVAAGFYWSLATNLEEPADPVALTTSFTTDPPAITLTWTDAADNEAGYLVERREGSGPWRTMALLGPDTELWGDTAVVKGVNYQYRVRAWR